MNNHRIKYALHWVFACSYNYWHVTAIVNNNLVYLYEDSSKLSNYFKYKGINKCRREKIMLRHNLFIIPGFNNHFNSLIQQASLSAGVEGIYIPKENGKKSLSSNKKIESFEYFYFSVLFFCLWKPVLRITLKIPAYLSPTVHT